MSAFPWKPIRFSRDLERRVDELFAEIVERGWGSSLAGAAVPNAPPDVRIEETERAFVVRLALPDVATETVQVHVDDDWVRICGSRRSAAVDRTGTHVVRSRHESHFCRTFRLAAAVEVSRMQVVREGDLLVVTLPKIGANASGTSRPE